MDLRSVEAEEFDPLFADFGCIVPELFHHGQSIGLEALDLPAELGILGLELIVMRCHGLSDGILLQSGVICQIGLFLQQKNRLLKHLASTNLLINATLKLLNIMIAPKHVGLELLLIPDSIGETMTLLIPRIPLLGTAQLQHNLVLLSL